MTADDLLALGWERPQTRRTLADGTTVTADLCGCGNPPNDDMGLVQFADGAYMLCHSACLRPAEESA